MRNKISILALAAVFLASFVSSCNKSHKGGNTQTEKSKDSVKPLKKTDAGAKRFFKGKKIPPGFPKKLVLHAAEVYDGLSVLIDNGAHAFSVRYTVKENLKQASDNMEKVIKAFGYSVERLEAPPRITFKFSSKDSHKVTGKVHILPTSKIDEVDVQVLLIK
ncbi:MAG: hypothetical protein GXP49_07910 [Deltaproteobacteria bacterium]|nr:hypothetical protein [Deltaproteobacteria bacterium]